MRTIFRSILVTILVLFFTAGTRAIVFTNLYTFSPGKFNTPTAGGYYPQAGLLLFSNDLYGTTVAGGSNNVGTVFAYSPASGGFTNLYTFNGSNGANPQADLVASGKTLFGTTVGGGAYGGGTIFAVNTNGTGFTNLFNFAFTNGANPQAGLASSGGVLYGTTSAGGAYGAGTLFAINTNGTGFTNLFNFDYTNGASPRADLLLLGGTLYGATLGGGNGWGTIFAINTNGTGFTNLFSFSVTNGANPGRLTLVSNVLCGTTAGGGVGQQGTVFLIATNGTDFNILFNFGTNINDGEYPNSGLTVLSNGASSYSIYGTTSLGSLDNINGSAFVLNVSGPTLNFSSFTVLSTFNSSVQQPLGGLLLSPALPALYGIAAGAPPFGNGSIFSIGFGGGTPTVLHSFSATTSYAVTNSDGASPLAGLVSSGNTLYGTASSGGANGNGAIFAINMDGTIFTNLCSLSNPDGSPEASLTLSGNMLYGTASSIVSLDDGINFGTGAQSPEVFALNTDGSGFTNIVSPSGESLQGSLVLANGTLYGTTYIGGSGFAGTVFAVNTNGTAFTNLYNFDFTTGGNLVGIVLSGNTLYGTAEIGGSNNQGTIFAINTDGTGFTNLFNFSGTNGYYPYASLIMSGNRLYGTAAYDTVHGYGTIFAINADGSDFTNLYFFNGYDGAAPLGGLVLSNNVLYGTTSAGGLGGFGTVFAVNTDGTGFTTLYNFSGGRDGATPDGDGLLFSGNTLYGTTSNGGSGGSGTVFALSLGPIPLGVEPAGGKVVLRWGNPAISLQSAPTVDGPYTTVSGAASPWTNTVTTSQQFFRLQAP